MADFVPTLQVPAWLPSPTGQLVAGQHFNDAIALATWLDACRSTMSPHTCRSYEREAMRFRMWCEWQLGDSPRLLASIKAHHASGFLAYLANPQPLPRDLLGRYGRKSQPISEPLSQSSQRQAVAILGTMYKRFALLEADHGLPYVAFNPFALLGATGGKATHAVSPRQSAALSMEAWKKLEVYLADRAQKTGAAADIRNHWLLQLLYRTWLRRAEVASLRMCSFSQEKGVWKLSVTRKGGKLHHMVVTDKLLGALKAYRVANGLAALPSPLDTSPAVLPLRGTSCLGDQSIYLIVKAVFDDYTAVIEQSDPDTASLLRRFATHLLRHTGITHAVENDVNVRFVSVQAGHSDIRTTMQHYYHAQDRVMLDALNAAD